MVPISPSSQFCLRLSKLVILSLLWLAIPVSAQRYRFDHWTTDNGLPQNTIRNIVQTRDGYLWMTTFDSLVRDVFACFGEFSQSGEFEEYFVELFEFFRGAQAWEFFADFEPALIALKARGLRLEVSSNFDARLYDVLDGLHLRAYFDSIHISTEVGAANPESASFRQR